MGVHPTLDIIKDYVRPEACDRDSVEGNYADRYRDAPDGRVYL
jgi:hypothetical protein